MLASREWTIIRTGQEIPVNTALKIIFMINRNNLLCNATKSLRLVILMTGGRAGNRGKSVSQSVTHGDHHNLIKIYLKCVRSEIGNVIVDLLKWLGKKEEGKLNGFSSVVAALKNQLSPLVLCVSVIKINWTIFDVCYRFFLVFADATEPSLIS